MIQETPRPVASPTPVELLAGRAVTSRRPDDIWLADLTTVPTSLGLWTSWFPFALPQRWPFCWWIALVVDHYSRRIMGVAEFRQPPRSATVRTFLGRAMQQAGSIPRYLVSDQGTQFTDEAFRRWCRRRSIRQRFGALGKHGSIAVIERLIRTMKQECTRRLLLPFTDGSLHQELALFSRWYSEQRPHDRLSGATPHEIHREALPAYLQPRFEPRANWPRSSPCARQQAPVRGRRGARLELHVSYLSGASNGDAMLSHRRRHGSTQRLPPVPE